MNLSEIIAHYLEKLKLGKRDKSVPAQPPAEASPVTASPLTAPTDKRESKEIEAAHSYLQVRWPQIKEKFESTYPGYTLKLAFVWRSVSYQQELFQIGRRGVAGEKIVTNCDGINKPSKHNHWPAKAIDVNIYKDGKVLWADKEYEKLTAIVQELGLVHGITWTSLPDPQHIEVPRNIV